MIDYTGAGSPDPPSPGPWVYHYLRDVLGSVVGFTDEGGNLVERYTYDPYGGVIAAESFGPHAVNRRMRDPHVRWCGRLGPKVPRLPDFRIPQRRLSPATQLCHGRLGRARTGETPAPQFLSVPRRF